MPGQVHGICAANFAHREFNRERAGGCDADSYVPELIPPVREGDHPGQRRPMVRCVAPGALFTVVSRFNAHSPPLAVQPDSLTRFAWLSVAAAVLTIVLKAGAYWVTGSVGLLSDALESVVNLAAALMALAMLTIAARPADESHAYGHFKAEYFASAAEGTLIVLAAAGIATAAVDRLLNPHPVEAIGLGLVISMTAALVNLGVARVLFGAGRRHRSVTLKANAGHLMTDVWTSGGVVIGIVVVTLTDWQWLDPVVALLVAANIVWTGITLVRGSALGLLDTALPPDERAAVQMVLDRYVAEGVQYHAGAHPAGWSAPLRFVPCPGSGPMARCARTRPSRTDGARPTRGIA